MSHHKMLFKQFSVVAFLALVCLFTPANAQTVHGEQTEIKRAQNASPVDQDAAANVADADTNEPPRQVDEQKEPEFKVGRIIFPNYDFELGQKKLFYGLYLPKSFDESKTYPLVVVLHGLNGSPGQILAYPGLTRHADDNNYILVAPMGYNARGWYGSRGKGGGRGADPKNLGELSEQDVMDVLKLTRQNFKIDSNRIYLFGHSMGGGGSMHLAAQFPKIWAAIAVVAPALYGDGDRLAPAKSIPAYVVQGDQDRLVSVRATRRWVEKMKQLKMKHEYVEVKNGGHVFLAWQHFDGIFEFFAANPKTTQPGSPN
jgi:predicted peptidase